MRSEEARQRIGCLVIGNGMSGEGALSGLSAALEEDGVTAAAFCASGGRGLHLELQRAYQAVRRECGVSSIAAAGVGCEAALALAGQLPVDRLVLLTGESWGGRGMLPAALSGPMRRIRAYARRGASFCVADVMILQFGAADRGSSLAELADGLCNCRVWGIALPEEAWINRKDTMKKDICGFLRCGVLPKSLAENSEMCIIYE